MSFIIVNGLVSTPQKKLVVAVLVLVVTGETLAGAASKT